MTEERIRGVTLAEYEQTILRYRDRVYGYAVRMMGDREQAADLVQDAMLKMWDHRETVTADGAPGWLIRVTRNTCLDALRRRSFETGLFDTDAETEYVSSGEPETDRAAATGVLRDHLERALARLSEPYRSIVILREVEECRYDEIGGALNLPMSSVKVYLHRARKMLREAILHELHGEAI